jgi:hypothetical protein
VKQFGLFFRTFWLTVSFLFFAGPMMAEKLDSVEISLITCTPHEEVYSLYGHTAIRYHNLQTGEDLVFNYGVFNFNAPHFVARFVLGKTDYELGIVPMRPFCKYYQEWGSEVIEQVLNISNEEKSRIAQALAVNYLPQNRVYRYNFFYDNCSTRPRDIIVNNLSGRVIYSPREDYHPTYREMIHELTNHHPWTKLGNDLLLGAKADKKTTLAEQEFLPLNLSYDFDRAQILDNNGEYRPLIKERRILVNPGVQIIEEGFPLSPMTCALILLCTLSAILAYEWKVQRHFAWLDALLMLLTGIAGLLLLVMFFSEHPTTSTNLQILLLNPIALLFIPSVLRKGKESRYWNFMLACIALFFLGEFLQDYAEGTEILALCLLTRYCSHCIINTQRPVANRKK